MYSKRVKIFVVLSAIVLFVYLLRLIQMQVLPRSSVQGKIAELELQRGLTCRLNTLRGKMLDRKGKVLATDELRFQLNISYKLTCFADERVRRAKLLRAVKKSNQDTAAVLVQEEIETRLENLQQVIDKCVQFGVERGDMEDIIKGINDRIWNLRTFLAWSRNSPSANVLEKHNHEVASVPLSEAVEDFKRKFPDPNQRLLLTAQVDDIAEIRKVWPLLELKTEDDIFTAQLEFMNVDGVEVVPKSHRIYPFGAAAAQTIGWVGPVTRESDKLLFADDRLLRYLADEVCGREDGVEYVCESILRGRRGEAVYETDGRRIERTQPQFGRDVRITLDIEMQKKIEQRLTDCSLNPNCEAPSAAVVIDVATGDILALVSVPVFDLNRVRFDYGKLVADKDKPLLNRAVNKQYPPGSVVKPLILIAAMESGKITDGEIISCSARPAPGGWPDCWIYNSTYHSQGHDDQWHSLGGNVARNAIKGSCNVYFSRLAHRLVPAVLQQWLWKFGYSRKILNSPDAVIKNGNRKLRQASGQISSVPQKNTDLSFEQLPPLEDDEKKWFGIGQGNLRATPLQVANAMAVIARRGFYKHPRLFVEDNDSQSDYMLEISPHTLNIVRDGMNAVVNEPGGTAYSEFAYAGFTSEGVKIYGKTGSTEKPENAWFAGFAEDHSGRGIAVAVLVEGGKRGSSDAAPVASDIIRFCIEAGYIGLSGR